MLAAKTRTRRCAIWSPLRSRRRKAAPRPGGPERAAESAMAAELDMLFNRRDELEFFLHHRFGEAGILQRLNHVLTVRQHPPKHVRDDFSLGSILNGLRNQQPSEAGNRISVFAGRVCDRNP